MAVYFILLKGKHDTKVKWPFIGRVMFILLNQLEDSNHHIRRLPVGAADDARVGTKLGIRLISHSELTHNPVKNTQYLKDNTLYFRVLVEVDDYNLG